MLGAREVGEGSILPRPEPVLAGREQAVLQRPGQARGGAEFPSQQVPVGAEMVAPGSRFETETLPWCPQEHALEGAAGGRGEKHGNGATKVARCQPCRERQGNEALPF